MLLLLLMMMMMMMMVTVLTMQSQDGECGEWRRIMLMMSLRGLISAALCAAKFRHRMSFRIAAMSVTRLFC